MGLLGLLDFLRLGASSRGYLCNEALMREGVGLQGLAFGEASIRGLVIQARHFFTIQTCNIGGKRAPSKYRPYRICTVFLMISLMISP